MWAAAACRSAGVSATGRVPLAATWTATGAMMPSSGGTPGGPRGGAGPVPPGEGGGEPRAVFGVAVLVVGGAVVQAAVADRMLAGAAGPRERPGTPRRVGIRAAGGGGVGGPGGRLPRPGP